MSKNKILVVRATSWESARKLGGNMISWHFRGQPDAKWDLSSSIERTAAPYGTSMLLSTIEAGFIYELRRRAHHYLASPPSEDAHLEWLAMLQHYGCPTRLLDFTHSFYVATFFAVEQATTDASVWAVDYSALHKILDAKLDRKVSHLSLYDVNRSNISAAESFIGTEKQQDLVLDVEPERINERLSIQRGLFLFPCNIQATFMQNLFSTFDVTKPQYELALAHSIASDTVSPSLLEAARVVKLVLPVGCHATALSDLRDMNLTSATLFPGLDGFARSLRYRLQPTFDDDWEANWQSFRERDRTTT